MYQQLRDTSRDALMQCENVADACGFTMTTGGEVEWYSVMLDNAKKISPAEAQRQFLDEVRADQQHFLNSPFVKRTDKERHAALNINLTESQTPEQDIQRWAEEYAQRNMSSSLAAANQLLMLRVYHRMRNEGIRCDDLLKEVGGVSAHRVAVQEADGTKSYLTAQQLEVSTGMTTPGELAIWLERLHTIITEESARLGMEADFRSKPPYTYKTDHGMIEEPDPGSAQHIHFGLRHKDSRRNAFRTRDGENNKLADDVSLATIRLLKQGGQVLANPVDEDYDRMRFFGLGSVPPVGFGNKQDDKYMALREIPGDDQFEAHKELRVMGGSTPPPSAVLLPVLAMTDALLAVIGKNIPQSEGWKKHLGPQTPTAYLRHIAKSITDDDRKKLHDVTQTPSAIEISPQGSLVTSLKDAKATVSSQSAFARLTPGVYSAIQAIEPPGVAF